MKDEELEGIFGSWVRLKMIMDEIAEVILNERAKKKNEEQQGFKAGDRVQIKSWEEMEKEFGVDDSRPECRSIKTKVPFADQMKFLCGSFATIDRFCCDPTGVLLKDFSVGQPLRKYLFCLDMLKHAEKEKNPTKVKENGKIKIGDKVRIINNEFGHKGLVCDVVDKDKNAYILYCNKNRRPYVYREQDLELYAELCWDFTDDEKVILRNLADEFEWVARDKDGSLFIFGEKPRKASDYWDADLNVESLIGFNHLFQSIKWADGEPCEFRKFI